MTRTTIIDIELCSGCTFRCTFCPRDQIRRVGKFMSLDTVSKIAAILDESKIAWFSGLGEPFLNPNFAEAVRILRGSKARVYSNTNASTEAFKATLHKAMKEGLSFLNVSVYGWTRERYIQTTGQDKFEVVLENVGAAWRSGIPMRLSYVSTRPPAEDDSIKASLRAYFGLIPIRLLRAHGRASGADQEPPLVCGLATNYRFITCDGIVLPCVNDVKAEYPLLSLEEAEEANQTGYPYPICRK